MPRPGPPEVLFTGFPGFIGARLLPRLLALRPEWRFRCLVQDRFLPQAREGIAAIAREHPHTRGRLAVVVGDITRENLGLERAEARALAATLEGAFHLAAVYDLAVAREVGVRINVDGTRNVLRLLQDAPRLERLHYVSTAYVSGRARGVFRETDLDVGQSFKNFYEETKFLAEVDVAGSGVPATVYRPSIVVGDSRTGETAKFDGPYFVLSAMERLPSPGVFPRIGSGANAVDLAPVDFVVEGLARLATIGASRGRTYHLTDPEPPRALEIARLLAGALGKRFLYVPVPALVAAAAFRPALVQSFFGMPVQALDYFDHPCRHDPSQALHDLEPLGVRCPPFASYVDRLVRFYRDKKAEVRRSAMI
ncbi:MAG TPA: SDR family oxidoreductase [Vicinamibacteria bacterium]|nr:SDR family oxidoreductase [Vicinamibacteria bacterium]